MEKQKGIVVLENMMLEVIGKLRDLQIQMKQASDETTSDDCLNHVLELSEYFRGMADAARILTGISYCWSCGDTEGSAFSLISEFKDEETSRYAGIVTEV